MVPEHLNWALGASWPEASWRGFSLRHWRLIGVGCGRDRRFYVGTRLAIHPFSLGVTGLTLFGEGRMVSWVALSVTVLSLSCSTSHPLTQSHLDLSPYRA